MGWWRLARRGSLFLLVAIGISLLSLVALAQKERDDRFCVACHLHEEKFDRFRAPAAKDLAGAHHRAKTSVRCIDCHGGADLGMRLRVWTVAGLDTVRFLVGRYGEPDHMRLPLRDQECKQCHEPILSPTRRASLRKDAFHVLREHRDIKYRCVACHTGHTLGEARFQFVDSDRVAPICRDCHKE